MIWMNPLTLTLSTSQSSVDRLSRADDEGRKEGGRYEAARNCKSSISASNSFWVPRKPTKPIGLGQL